MDVAVSAFAVDPYGWHPSSAAAASAPSELTLRSGGRELSMTNLTAPVLIGLPMAIPLDFDDRNPYTGARCGGPTRADCLLQLSRRNASHDAAVTHVGPRHMGSLPGRHRRWRQPTAYVGWLSPPGTTPPRLGARSASRHSCRSSNRTR